MTRWLTMLALLGVLLISRTAAAQDPNAWARSDDGGATWHASDGGTYDYPTWETVQCGVAAAHVTVWWWIGFQISPIVGSTMFAACYAAVLWNQVPSWINWWTGQMAYFQQMYLQQAFQYTWWVQTE